MASLGTSELMWLLVDVKGIAIPYFHFSRVSLLFGVVPAATGAWP